MVETSVRLNFDIEKPATQVATQLVQFLAHGQRGLSFFIRVDVTIPVRQLTLRVLSRTGQLASRTSMVDCAVKSHHLEIDWLGPCIIPLTLQEC